MEKEYSTDLIEILQYIDPGTLNYQEWVNVGMGLKEAGHTVDVWDDWSSRDAGRYERGECAKKWETFRGTAKPVTAGTIVQMAMHQGWRPPQKDEERELSWDDIIGNKDELVVINKHWLEGKDVAEPKEWDPVKQLIKYLETLFESTENVGYVTRSFEKDDSHKPTKGCWDRTAGELIQQLSRCNGDIGSVLGDYNVNVGAWIRFNPLDGKGIRNENVADFRYALVESDSTEIDKQNAIIRELELPVACLVHSGKKSLHAIVHIDAADYQEYRKRVDYLYMICRKNGLEIDAQNRNPSRLSRMPGVMRDGHKQFLIDTNIGKKDFTEWQEWIEAVNDDLPEPESMAAVWDNLPELSPSLIAGVLRQGHKMLIAGPSKAGKSFSLIELCCAIAEGEEWLEWECTKGRVMYVNLELDRASCLHRFKDVYNALGWQPKNLNNIDIWNLRGKSVPMDKLAPKLIRRATKKNYIAIVIDPIYKVITGDENSADQMAHFCNQFDKVCTELGCAVIYCHHHSKGGQGNKKSMDRASGSGVFARDPDAMIDLIELEVNEALLKQEENKAVSVVCIDHLNHTTKGWEDEVSQDEQCSEKAMLDACKRLLSVDEYQILIKKVHNARQKNKQRTAWRIEGTLREFPKFSPINLWFDYPVHHVDQSGALSDIEADVEQPSWRKNFGKKKTPEDGKKKRRIAIENAFEGAGFGGQPTIKSITEYMGVTEKTVKSHLKEHGGFMIISGGEVMRKTEKVD